MRDSPDRRLCLSSRWSFVTFSTIFSPLCACWIPPVNDSCCGTNVGQGPKNGCQGKQLYSSYISSDEIKFTPNDNQHNFEMCTAGTITKDLHFTLLPYELMVFMVTSSDCKVKKVRFYEFLFTLGWRLVGNTSLYKFPAPKHVSFRKYSSLKFRVFTVRDTKRGMLSPWKKVSPLDFRQFNHFKY